MSERNCSTCNYWDSALGCEESTARSIWHAPGESIGQNTLARICRCYSERVENEHTCDSCKHLKTCGLCDHATAGEINVCSLWSKRVELCGAVSQCGKWKCFLSRGHEGAHKSNTGVFTWDDPTPTAFDKAWEKQPCPVCEKARILLDGLVSTTRIIDSYEKVEEVQKLLGLDHGFVN